MGNMEPSLVRNLDIWKNDFGNKNSTYDNKSHANQ